MGEFLARNAEALVRSIGVHLFYTLVSVAIGFVLGLGLGILLSRFPRQARFILPLLSLFNTIPGVVFIGLLFLVLHGTSSAYVGEVFNFIMGGVFAFSAGFVYQRNKSRKGALLGAVIGAVLMSLLSVPLNYYVVYPAYVVCYKLPLDAIVGMYQAIRPSANGLLECLVTFNMPFTFFKGMLDVALCFLVYKPLSPLLHK